MQINNLTHPGQAPVDGDVLQYIHANGTVETKQYWSPVDPDPYAPPPSRILTHLEFRRLFTPTEQELSDELEATFESNGGLTAEQKRKLRTGYKNFNKATAVNLDDPDIPPMLAMYVALGILGADRPAEILA